MQYVAVALQINQWPAFSEYLRIVGINVRESKADWELAHVNQHGAYNRFYPVTYNKRHQVKVPEWLHEHYLQFVRNTQDGCVEQNADTLTDTQRLDFILSKGRRVEVEVRGYNSQGEEHYVIGVIQGSFDDVVHQKVHFTGKELKGEQMLALKRQAIDLAINEQ